MKGDKYGFNKNSKFWNKKKIVEEKKKNFNKVFKKEKTFSAEINSTLKISLYSKAINKSFLNNFDNNNGRINFNGDFKYI